MSTPTALSAQTWPMTHSWHDTVVEICARDGRAAILGCLVCADIGYDAGRRTWCVRLEQPFARGLTSLAQLFADKFGEPVSSVRFYFPAKGDGKIVLGVDVREVLMHGISAGSAVSSHTRALVVDYIVFASTAPQEIPQ